MGREGAIGLLIVIISILFLINTMGISTPPLVPLSPAFYPRILLTLLLILGVILFVSSILKRKPPEVLKDDTGEISKNKEWLIRYKKVLSGFIIFGLYILFIPISGFYSATAVLLVIFQGLLGYREIKQLPFFLATSVITTICIYFIFEKYLMVVFPKGYLF